MNFDNLVNNNLGEELSREDRIKALRDLGANKSFRVIEAAEGRATDIVSDKIVDGTSIEAVAEEQMLKVKQVIRDQFEGEGEEGADVYIENWFEGPVYNDDRSQSQFIFGEENSIIIKVFIILSKDSKYFDYSQDDLYDNWREMCNEVKWYFSIK
jgi:hypothetical protein